MARNLDGRFRNNNKAARMPDSIPIARWIESEVLALKLLGLTFRAIAERIVAIVAGRQLPMSPLPPGLSFPDDYRITSAGCHKALSRALYREPRVNADLLGQILMHRSEELYLALQPIVRRGEIKAILAAVRVLELQANLSGAKGKLAVAPNTPVPEGPSPALPDLFGAAFQVLMDLGHNFPGYRIIRVEHETKLIETTATKVVEAPFPQGKKDEPDDESK